MANGRRFTWFVDRSFHPVRLVDIAVTGLPAEVAVGEVLQLELQITNPYPYDIVVGGTDVQLAMLWKHGRFRVEGIPGRGGVHDSGGRHADPHGDLLRAAAAGRGKVRQWGSPCAAKDIRIGLTEKLDPTKVVGNL